MWGVLKLILVQADLMRCRAVGRLAAPTTARVTDLKTRSRSPLGVLTGGRGLSAGHCSKPEPSPARLRSDSFKSYVTNGETPSWLATGRIAGLSTADQVIPARVRKGEKRPTIAPFSVIRRSSNETIRGGTEINLRYMKGQP